MVCKQSAALVEMIPDSAMTASSVWNNDYTWYAPYFSRLDSAKCWLGHDTKNHNGSWIQWDLGAEKLVAGVSTAGHPQQGWHVTTYKLSYSNDAFITQNTSKTFSGNGDPAKINAIHPPVMARWIRLSPLSWSVHPCLRAELFAGTATNEDGGRRLDEAMETSVPAQSFASGVFV
jgi:hypothetical protein